MTYRVNHTIGLGLDTLEEGAVVSDADLKGVDIDRLLSIGAITSTSDVLAASGISAESVNADLAAENAELKKKLDSLPKNSKAAAEQLAAVQAELKAAQDALKPFQDRNDELVSALQQLEAFKGAMTAEEVAEVEKRLADTGHAPGGN